MTYFTLILLYAPSTFTGTSIFSIFYKTSQDQKTTATTLKLLDCDARGEKKTFSKFASVTLSQLFKCDKGKFAKKKI